MVPTPLGVPDLDEPCAQVGEHRSGDIASVGAPVRRVHVLRAPADIRACQAVAGDEDRGKGRQDEQIAVADAGHQRHKGLEVPGGLARCQVHLPAGPMIGASLLPPDGQVRTRG
jgi:hypothetical protein